MVLQFGFLGAQSRKAVRGCSDAAVCAKPELAKVEVAAQGQPWGLLLGGLEPPVVPLKGMPFPK